MKLHTLIKELLVATFLHEDNRLKARVIQLVKENHSQGGSPDGFRYMGKVFTALETRLISKGQFKSAEASMEPAITLYLQDANMIDYDKIRVHQALAICLRNTSTRQDIRDALPECLVDVLPWAKDCPRIRPEAYTLVDNPRSYNQYQNIREKIEFYLASKMLY